MDIRPRTAVWWNFAFLILTGVAAGTINFVGLSDPITGLIKTYAANAAWLISVANIVFHLYSSPTPGPLAR